MKRKALFLSLAILFVIISVIFQDIFSFYLKCRSIRENTIRLHVIANSDSEQDQTLKLAVRDAILDAFGNIDTSVSKNDAEKIISGKLSDIISVAETVISEQGFDYTVRAELTETYFDTKEYDNFTMPSGNYDALRIIIGTGSGKNWWCVMFPPLCIPAAYQKNRININEYYGNSSEILVQKTKYKVKFAIVELCEKLIRKLKIS